MSRLREACRLVRRQRRAALAHSVPPTCAQGRADKTTPNEVLRFTARTFDFRTLSRLSRVFAHPDAKPKEADVIHDKWLQSWSTDWSPTKNSECGRAGSSLETLAEPHAELGRRIWPDARRGRWAHENRRPRLGPVPGAVGERAH